MGIRWLNLTREVILAVWNVFEHVDRNSVKLCWIDNKAIRICSCFAILDPTVFVLGRHILSVNSYLLWRKFRWSILQNFGDRLLSVKHFSVMFILCKHLIICSLIWGDCDNPLNNFLNCYHNPYHSFQFSLFSNVIIKMFQPSKT